MGHEHHCRAGPPALIDQVGDEASIGRVEIEQGFIAEQQCRVGGQCLRNAYPLQLPAGHHPDRDRCQGAAMNSGQGLLDCPSVRDPICPTKWCQTPAVPVDTQPDQVASAQAQSAVDGAVLRNVADPITAGLDG